MTRVAFGKTIAEQGVTRHWIGESRMEIDQARLLTLLANRRRKITPALGLPLLEALRQVMQEMLLELLAERELKRLGHAHLAMSEHYAKHEARAQKVVDALTNVP